MIWDACCVGEVGPGIEGRVNVNEIHLSGEFREERWQDIFFVAPDEAVAPFGVAAGGKKLKIAAAILRALVDRLDRLKRESNPYRPLFLSALVLPIPDEFGHVWFSGEYSTST